MSKTKTSTKTKAFAVPGGHQHQAAAAVSDMPDDVLLLRTWKGRQAEHRIQDGRAQRQ
jgi:hypothetical protein